MNHSRTVVQFLTGLRVFSTAHRQTETHRAFYSTCTGDSLSVTWSGHEADHSPLYNVEVNHFSAMYRPD
jgi:hypothetical protein